MASATSLVSSSILLSSSLPCIYLPISTSLNCVSSISTWVSPKRFIHSTSSRNQENLICRAAEYKFPDPIPEFADAETEKFRDHLLKKLPKKKDVYGDSVDEIVGICTEILNEFLHAEYGGPGTLLVVPFIDMADTINERGLPGGPQAARAAVKWAQSHVDNDWKEWNSGKKR
ncbi:protein PLASTID REDOX INSENSITIVE 2, chloroplastic-like [Lycium barbarum]|uniref:protein PLASTID REDOX INSENSITIVE 2, chloroplastic-like n=1 Tax=Lycium barbarum TaxID=112863 RepID=UPI00293EA36C|nr:protein PLASTID REDOX INSENSITIVE 2, chloroplastic-like [Lycium barbarum]